MTLAIQSLPFLWQGLLVTLQNRELQAFTDLDIQSCLEHLGALGVLSEFEIPEEQ